MHLPHTPTYHKGFTLIELAIVILLISLLAIYSIEQWPRKVLFKQADYAIERVTLLGLMAQQYATADINNHWPDQENDCQNAIQTLKDAGYLPVNYTLNILKTNTTTRCLNNNNNRPLFSLIIPTANLDKDIISYLNNNLPLVSQVNATLEAVTPKAQLGTIYRTYKVKSGDFIPKPTCTGNQKPAMHMSINRLCATVRNNGMMALRGFNLSCETPSIINYTNVNDWDNIAVNIVNQDGTAKSSTEKNNLFASQAILDDYWKVDLKIQTLQFDNLSKINDDVDAFTPIGSIDSNISDSNISTATLTNISRFTLRANGIPSNEYNLRNDHNYNRDTYGEFSQSAGLGQGVDDNGDASGAPDASRCTGITVLTWCEARHPENNIPLESQDACLDNDNRITPALDINARPVYSYPLIVR